MRKTKQDVTLPLRLLKICLTLVLCTFFFAKSSQAQDVSLTYSNVPVKTVLKAIEQQTDYSFVYSNSVDVEKTVSINVSKQSLETALTQLLSGVGISYQVNGKQIVLSPAKTDAPASNSETVKGIVKDDLDLPLEGATITVKGKQQFATTNANGEFNISGVTSGDILSVLFIGFNPVEIPVGNRSNIDVKMVLADATLLDGALVTGYTTLSKERATGAFNRVNSDVIEQRRASDLSSALLGTVAGMQGKENVDGSIDYTIRGTTSLYADATPLVVVDGFPVANGFKDVNPNDVENITVLKDAAAASIWGARSANGVIVITTKKAAAGSRQDKNVNISASAMVKIGSKLDLNTVLATASSPDHVYYEKLAFDNGWYSSEYTGTFSTMKLSPLTLVSEQLYAYRNGKITETELNAKLAELSKLNNRGQIKDLLLENPVLQQYNLTVSSANANVKNYFSALYEHGKGNMVENSNNRWRIHYNNQIKVFKWLDFNMSTNLHLFRNTTSGPTLDEISGLSPYEMILNPDGSYAEQLNNVNRELRAQIPIGVLPYKDWTYNILREARARKLEAEQLNTRIQAGLTFKLIDGLKLTSSIQYEYNKGEVENLYTEDSYHTRDFVNTWIDYDHSKGKLNKQYVPKGAILKTQKVTGENYVWRNQIDFNRVFADKHVVAVAGGLEIQEYKTNSQRDPWIFGYDPARNSSSTLNVNPTESVKDISGSVPYDIFPGVNNASREGLLPVYKYQLDRYVSVYGNASYTFNGKYSITGSIRSDASNLIADNASYRWAPLWSVGGKWNATQEGFMQSTRSWLDRLALRLTYGFNGNVEKSTSHKTLLGMSSAPSATFGGAYTGSVVFGNPELRWEKTSSVNLGIDFSLFSNLVFGSIDIYSKKGKDIIGEIALPSVLGTTTQKMNNAEISNQGIELEAGVNTKVTNDISFTGKLTYAYNKNKVLNLYNPSVYAHQMVGDVTSRKPAYVEGYAVDGIWAYNYLGMINGIPHVEGINGEACSMNDVSLHLRSAGLQFLKYQGSGIAPHTLGVNLSFSGYGFTLSAFVNGTFGGHFRNPTFNYTAVGRDKVVIPEFVSDVINGSNKVPSWPLPNTHQNYLWYRYVPYLQSVVESSSFIKLKEINLEYNLPARWTDAVGIGNTRVFAQVRDLGCIWTNNSKGYDPEWLPGTLKPSSTYAFGINVNF